MSWLQAVSDVTQGDKPRDIPETDPDSDAYSGEVDISGDIPEHLRAEPAVAEAERVLKVKR